MSENKYDLELDFLKFCFIEKKYNFYKIDKFILFSIFVFFRVSVHGSCIILPWGIASVVRSNNNNYSELLCFLLNTLYAITQQTLFILVFFYVSY